MLQRLWRDRRGATVIEYVLILALIAGVVIGAYSEMAASSGNLYNFVAAKMTSA